MSFELDEGIGDELNEGMNLGGTRIELPFLVPYVFIVNGNADLEEIGGVRYLGGWSTEAQPLLDAAESWGEKEAPAYMRKQTIKSKGKSMEMFVSRSMTFAPIATRISWFVNHADGTTERSPDYFPGARKHMQILVMLATKEGYFKPDGSPSERLAPWGPALLTAKGRQVGFLADALTKWQAAIEKVRKEVAPKVPAWLFWMGAGTYGAKPNFVTVGKGNDTSDITPIEPYIPEVIDTALLETLFVGNEVANSMLDYKRQAALWLEAWGHPTPRDSKQTAQTGGMAYPGMPPIPEPPPDDDIPF